MSSSSHQDSPLSQLQSTSHSTSNGKEMNRERKRGLSQLEGEIKFGRMSADTVNVSAAMRSSYGDNIQGQGCDTGGIPLSLAITVPFVTQVRECPTVENALQFLRTQRINEYRQAVYIDPLAKPSLQAPDDKNLLLLMDKAEEFLAGDGQVMLILGDSGAGKSTFNRHLEYVLWKNYKPGYRIPLLINLPALDRPDKALIVEQLRMLEFSEDQVWELKRHHKLLLICDGYDESQLMTNLHTTNNLDRSGQQDVKLIITCRSQYLGPDYRDRFVPKVTGAYYRLANELFHEVVIAPFSKDQIEKYVEKYVPLEPRTWVAEDYMDRLTSIPNLMDLVKNPFLLTLSLEALPKVVEGKSDLSGLRVTRLQLYDIFANHWLGVNKRRLQEQKLRDVNRQALDALLADGFEQNGIKFQKELAAAIFKEQDGRPFVDYSHMQDRETWKASFFGLDLERGLLRDSSLLSRAETQYRFVHRSVLECFFSCTICDADVGVDVEANADTDADAIPLSIGNHPLSLRSLVMEPSIIQFLAERVQTHPGFRKHLLALVSLSKTDDRASQAAANAITILVKAGQLFNGADLQGIRIPGADLTGGQFDSTQFQNANLNNVNLTKAWIRQANFSRAHMEGVRFGELPFLQEGDEVMSCAFSPDGRTFAAGLFNGNISVYDTATWRKARTFRGHEYKVVSLAFLPNSQQLVSCCRGRTVRTWDCGNEKTERIKRDHIDAAMAWTLSPTGQQAASSGSDGSLKLWDMQTDTVTSTLVRTNVNINCLVYSPNERRVASCGVGGRIQIFDVGTEPSLLSSTIEYRRTISLAFSPDGSRIVAGRESGAMRLYDSTTLVMSSQWMGHSGGVTGVCFSPDGQSIVSCGNDSLVKLWDSATSLLLATFMGHMNPVVSVVFSPDGLKIASSSRDKTVRLWEVNSIALVPQSHDLPQPPTSIAYSPCGRFLISGSRHGEVQQYDSETGEIYIVISTFPGGANCVACSPDGLRIVSGGRGGEMTVWNTQTGASMTCGHMGEVVCVSFSPCGKWIASAGTDLAVWQWDANSRKLIYDIGEV
jgi:WD40 repeat protein/energy-coupling factor transporter ATP-binding protein EcfA2